MLSNEEFSKCITALNVLAGNCYHLDKAVDKMAINWNNNTIDNIDGLLDKISGLESCIARAKEVLLKLKNNSNIVQASESLNSIRNQMKKLVEDINMPSYIVVCKITQADVDTLVPYDARFSDEIYYNYVREVDENLFPFAWTENKAQAKKFSSKEEAERVIDLAKNPPSYIEMEDPNYDDAKYTLYYVEKVF